MEREAAAWLVGSLVVGSNDRTVAIRNRSCLVLLVRVYISVRHTKILCETDQNPGFHIFVRCSWICWCLDAKQRKKDHALQSQI
jgi:hypothetical protein